MMGVMEFTLLPVWMVDFCPICDTNSEKDALMSRYARGGTTQNRGVTPQSPLSRTKLGLGARRCASA